MKRLLIVIMVAILIFGCENVDKNNQKTLEWIETHKKPIIVHRVSWNGWNGNSRYSLQSADNKFFYTGEINYVLPDTIK